MLSLTALPAVAQESTPSVGMTTACTDLPGIGADGDVLVSNLVFGGASEYLEVPAGTYDLEVRVAGTMDVALPGTTLDGDTLYDVIAVGTAAEGTLTMIVVPSITSHAE